MTDRIRALFASRLAWPLIALILLIAANAIKSPGFLAIRVHEGHLFGSLIDITRNGAPIVLVALGMTLVIATRGIDLSVGAVVAISGAFALSIIGDAQKTPTTRESSSPPWQPRSRSVSSSGHGTASWWRYSGYNPSSPR